MDSWFTHDSNLIEYIESYDKDWIGPLRSNRNVTYGGEEIHVDALEERIDTVEREIDDKTYKIWTQKRSVSKLGEVRLLIAEKVTDEEDEENPVRYFASNKIDAPSEHLIRSYSFRWPVEVFFEDSKQDLGFGDCEVRDEGGASRSGLRKVWILTAPIGCMSGTRRFDVREHLSEADLDIAINEAQKADEARLVRRLCFVKNLYTGDVLEEAARRVGVSQANSSRWAHAWNDVGVDGLRPSFGGGRPPKLSDEQFAELCEILEEGQPWTPRAIHALIEERYGVTYDSAHLSRKLRASGMHYAKPRPMDPRSPDNADEILAERLGEALGEEDTDEQEDDPVVLGFFR